MSTKSTHFNTTAKTSAVTGTSPWKLLGTLIAPYKGLAIFTLLTLLCDIVGMLYIPTELSALINAAVTNHDMVALTSHSIRMFMAALLGSGGCIVSYWLASRLAARIGRDLRMAVYKHSLEFSGSDFNRFGTGSMITRTLSDANVVQQTFLMCFTMMFPVPVTCIVSVVLAFSTDATMGWILLAVIAVSLIVSAIAVKISAPIFVVMQNFIDGINARLRESITGVRVIRAFGKEAYERSRMTKTFEDYASRAIRVNLIFAITDCTTFFLMNAVESLVMWAGANRVGIHAMQIGSISALIEYAMLIMFFMMMAQFAMLEIPRALACLERSAAVLDQKPTITDRSSKTVSFGQTDEVARFDHASLRFDDADEDTLQDLCFSLRRGQTTAIIGNTGSGKSTIAKMLLRMYRKKRGSSREPLPKTCVLVMSMQTMPVCGMPLTWLREPLAMSLKTALIHRLRKVEQTSPAASANAWLLPEPWRAMPTFIYLTTHSPRWTIKPTPPCDMRSKTSLVMRQCLSLRNE